MKIIFSGLIEYQKAENGLIVCLLMSFPQRKEFQIKFSQINHMYDYMTFHIQSVMKTFSNNKIRV